MGYESQPSNEELKYSSINRICCAAALMVSAHGRIYKGFCLIY